MALQTLLFFRWPLPFVRDCQRRYGDAFTLRIVALGKIVYLADPALIQILFAHDGREGHAGAVNSVLEPVTGRDSILLLDREHHLAERRLLSPGFHGEVIGRLEEVAREATEREMQNWEDGMINAFRPATQRITFEVIVQAVLGVNDPALRQLLLDAFEPVFDVPLTAMVPALRVDLGRLSPYGRFRRAMRRLDRILLDLIAERRTASPREDVLGMLLAATDADGDALSDRHVRDELVTLLLAGHETTATALAWALERLAHHPAVVEALRAELTAGKSGLIDAVGAETLRIRPVVMDVGRRLSDPLVLGERTLPAGTTVMPGIYLVHLDDRNHSDPASFDPTRFVEQRPSKDTWLPFGGGRRRCLGAGLAQMELRVILSTILSQWVPIPASVRAEKPRLRGITLAPEHNARLKMIYRPLTRSSESMEPPAKREQV